MIQPQGDSDCVYMALDQGTHSSRVMLFDAMSKVVFKTQASVDLERIDDVTVQQDPDELLQSLAKGIRDAVSAAQQSGWTIAAAGLATQRSSVVAWDRSTGKAVSPVISWQDRRAWKSVESLEPLAATIRELTGLPLTPHYGASKIHWLLSQYLPQQSDLPTNIGVGPLASFLVANLVVDIPYCVDHTNALRTQLMNLETLDWDAWLLKTFNVPAKTLPKCVPVIHDYGMLAETNVPLAAVSGDQTAAMFGHGVFPRRTALVNLGTGGFILKPCDRYASADKDLLGGLSISDGKQTQYITEGTVNGCGSALKWAAKELNLTQSDHNIADEWLEHSFNPPLFLNTVSGLGSPWWKPGPGARWCNMHGEPIQRPDPKAAMVAVLESIVFLIYENFRRMMRHESLDDIRVSGGLSSLDGVCHRLANLTGCRVTRFASIESTASGVAWMAAGQPETWGKEKEDTVFVPSEDAALLERYDALRRILASS